MKDDIVVLGDCSNWTGQQFINFVHYLNSPERREAIRLEERESERRRILEENGFFHHFGKNLKCECCEMTCIEYNLLQLHEREICSKFDVQNLKGK